MWRSGGGSTSSHQQQQQQQPSSHSGTTSRLRPPPLASKPTQQSSFSTTTAAATTAPATTTVATPQQRQQIGGGAKATPGTGESKASPKQQPPGRLSGGAVDDDEIIKGIRLQHQFAERPELNGMISSIAALVRYSGEMVRRLNDTTTAGGGISGSPPALVGALPPSDEWHVLRRNIRISVERYKCRVLRHLGHLEARRDDLIRILKSPQNCISSRHLKESVEEAKEELCRSKIKRKHRDEYERLAAEINKRQCSSMINEAAAVEKEGVEAVSREIDKFEKRWERHQKQASEFLSLCQGFKESVLGRLPTTSESEMLPAEQQQ